MPMDILKNYEVKQPCHGENTQFFVDISSQGWLARSVIKGHSVSEAEAKSHWE